MDSRFYTLAHNLVTYSVHLEKGEKVLIEVFDEGLPLAKALVREAYAVGAIPYISIKDTQLLRLLYSGASKEQFEGVAKWEAQRMNAMDAYIAVRAYANTAELSAVPDDKMALYQNIYNQQVHMDIRIPKKKWVVLRYPNNSMAQLANASLDDFEDFYFNVCNLDYGKMEQAMAPLVNLMNRTDKVHLTGPGTDLHFSIKGIPAVTCSGRMNIPDGEVYTAPVKDSVNGVISYNTPSLQNGTTFEKIRFEFKDGKIIKATANETEKLNKILDTDDGARYIGEFSFGLNPYVKTPMKDILFDEKISGSFHLTPGNAYDDAF
ncbi:MAG: aminopeptidase, partial [Megasphaera sp.]|nr:aminopeptidase [Megasphaera sp.]